MVPHSLFGPIDLKELAFLNVGLNLVCLIDWLISKVTVREPLHCAW